MALNSNIEWTHHTANLWWGCANVHEGCDNCYAERLANRYGVKWGNEAARKEIKGTWGNLLGMQAKAAAAKETHRVFVGSMMDIFEKPMPVVNAKGELTGYSTDYETGLTVGGHDLFTELKQSDGKYLIIELNFSE